MDTQKNEIIFEVLQATGLNWTVSKQPIYFGEGNEIPNNYATVRSDNNQPLGLVKGRYEILQNHETVETIYEAGKEVFDHNGVVKHPWNNAETLGTYGNMAGGSLKGGAAVFVQLQLEDGYIGKSDIKRFITITNHHDGSKSLGFGTTNQVVCCANTFAIANKDLSKIRHTASMNERVDEAVKSLRRMLEFEEKQMEIFDKASTISMNNSHLNQLFDLVFNETDVVNKVNNKDVSTRTINQVELLASDINQSIQEHGKSSLWALFNGVTRYTNHSRGAKDKDYSLMFGQDARINQNAYNLLQKQVGIFV